jgi:hypothetical protein
MQEANLEDAFIALLKEEREQKEQPAMGPPPGMG